MYGDDHALERRRTRSGAAALIGLGVTLLAWNIVPAALHGALVLACIALVFGGLYALGILDQRWARMVAFFFGALAAALAFHMLFFHTGHPFFAGFGLPFWPLLLVVLGLALLRRRARYQW